MNCKLDSTLKMIDAFLIAEKTVITAKGDSEPLDVSAAANPAFLATLTITQIVEQESFELSFFTLNCLQNVH